MTLAASVAISWVNTVLAAAQRQGVDRLRLLQHAGIAESQLQAVRWPVDDITRLWRAAAMLTRDPAFGLKAGAWVGPSSFNVVGLIVQTSATLREAIGQVQRFQSLISDGGRFQLLAGEHASWLVYHPRAGELPFHPHQIEAVVSAVVSFSRWLLAEHIHPVRVQFSHNAQAPWLTYHEVLQCPVDFDQAFNGLLLSNAMLDQTLPQADPSLTALQARYAAAHLAQLQGKISTAEQLKIWLTQHLGSQAPTKAAAAQALGISPRTLARRLQQEKQSFRQALDEVRRDAALEAVAHTKRSFVDIADSLGYADPSIFHRSFLRWTSHSPGQWRQHIQTTNHGPITSQAE